MSKNIIREKYPDFKSEIADVNGIKIHYVKMEKKKTEEGKHKLIVFLHGFPQFWYMWRDQLTDFGEDYLAVAPDMRGYNLSSKPLEIEKYKMELLVEDMRALVQEHLGYDKFILVGHDWGGIVAFAIANQYPELIEKFIIINAPHPSVFARLLSKNKDQQSSSQYVLFFRSENAEKTLLGNECAMLLNIIKTPDMEFSEDDRLIYIEGFQQPGAITGGLNYYRAAGMNAPSQGEQISDVPNTSMMEPVMINVPTLIIWAESDSALTIHNLEGLDEFITELKVKRIPKASHWVINEQPQVINKLIREFIE